MSQSDVRTDPRTATAGAKVGTGTLRPYRLTRVEKIDAPEGAEGANWYRYVLENGRSTITGQRCGSRQDVTTHAENCARQLNARRRGNFSPWSPRSSAAAK